MTIKKVLTRICVRELDSAVELYETIFKEKCALRFQYPEMHLELAQVGSILLLCGSDEALEPFRATKATFLVDSVADFQAYLLQHGAKVIRDLKKVPTGVNMTLQHPDGTIVEYVEHHIG